MKFNSQIVTAASGSIGGCTFSRNRFGQYIRRRAMPVNPGSAPQNIMTAALASLVSGWKLLSQPTRDNWTNYALNTPYNDALGNTIILTGQQIYIACNASRIQIGVAIVSTAPSFFGRAILSPPVPVSLVASSGVLTYSFTATDTWAGAAGGFLTVYMSRPQSPTTLFFKGPYRFAGTTAGGVVPPTSPGTETSPFTYIIGQRCHVQFRALNADARISAISRATILAT